MIALFPSTVDQALIPAGIKTRLHVSLRDPDWKERIAAVAENRAANINRPRVYPYHLRIHRQSKESRGDVIEVRPRGGSWSPFVVTVPLLEKDRGKPYIMHGAPGRPPTAGALVVLAEGTNADWAFCVAQNEATPTMSYYIFCSELPSKLQFGTDGGVQYVVENLTG